MTAPGGNVIEIRINVRDNTAGGFNRVRRGIRGLDDDTARLADGLGVLPPQIGQFAVVGVPAMAAVGQAAAAAVPLILSLAAVGGTVAAGMDGIKAAAKQLKGPLDSLKSQVSAVFEKDLTATFAKLKPVIASLAGPMKEMAHSISGLVDGLVDVVVEAQELDQLDAIFAGAKDMIDSMAPGLQMFVKGMLDAGAAAAPAMASVGKAIGSVFAGIGDKLSSLASSGVLNQAIEGFASTLRGLGEVVGEVFETIVQMGAALGSGLGAALGVVAQVINALAPVFTVVAQAVSIALKTIATAINPVIDALAPLIEMLANAFGDALEQLAPVLAQIAETLGTALAGALQALAPSFQRLLDAMMAMVPHIADLAVQIGQFLAGAIAALAPLLPAIADAFISIMDAVVPLIPQITQLAKDVFPAVIEVIKFLVPIIAGLIKIFAECLAAVIKFCTDTKTQAATLAAPFEGAVKLIRAAFNINWGAIGQSVIDGIRNGISNGIGSLISAARNAAVSAYNAFMGALRSGSPSKLMRDGPGKSIPWGIAEGIRQNMGMVHSAIKPFASLGNSVDFGSVSTDTWRQLKAAGWKGRAGDGAERLYRPAGSAAPAPSGGGHGHTVTFAGNMSDALATVFMQMIRTGKIQIA